ncbi:MAG TPA: hypothetical protein VKD72_32290 [Gemmataceae bacterium]|nr:hypothetical protein [Gemmataceae bacterium]
MAPPEVIETSLPALIGSLEFHTGKDGLFYVPVKNRPWAYIAPVMQSICARR